MSCSQFSGTAGWSCDAALPGALFAVGSGQGASASWVGSKDSASAGCLWFLSLCKLRSTRVIYSATLSSSVIRIVPASWWIQHCFRVINLSSDKERIPFSIWNVNGIILLLPKSARPRRFISIFIFWCLSLNLNYPWPSGPGFSRGNVKFGRIETVGRCRELWHSGSRACHRGAHLTMSFQLKKRAQNFSCSYNNRELQNDTDVINQTFKNWWHSPTPGLAWFSQAQVTQRGVEGPQSPSCGEDLKMTSWCSRHLPLSQWQTGRWIEKFCSLQLRTTEYFEGKDLQRSFIQPPCSKGHRVGVKRRLPGLCAVKY